MASIPFRGLQLVPSSPRGLGMHLQSQWPQSPSGDCNRSSVETSAWITPRSSVAMASIPYRGLGHDFEPVTDGVDLHDTVATHTSPPVGRARPRRARSVGPVQDPRAQRGSASCWSSRCAGRRCGAAWVSGWNRHTLVSASVPESPGRTPVRTASSCRPTASNGPNMWRGRGRVPSRSASGRPRVVRWSSPAGGFRHA